MKTLEKSEMLERNKVGVLHQDLPRGCLTNKGAHPGHVMQNMFAGSLRRNSGAHEQLVHR